MGLFDKIKKILSRRTADGVIKKNAAFGDLQVLISCSARDNALGKKFAEQLKEKGCRVFFAPESIPAGGQYSSVITDALSETAETGWIIVLITGEAVKSPWVEKEITYSFSRKGNIVPVLVGNTEMSDVMRYCFGNRPLLRLPDKPTDKEVALAIREMAKIFHG